MYAPRSVVVMIVGICAIIVMVRIQIPKGVEVKIVFQGNNTSYIVLVAEAENICA